MTTFQSIFLGIVQGLTEFIPVSSSGHLLLLPKLFNWPQQSLSFDITMHMATLIAIIVYFKKDFYELIVSCVNDFKGFTTSTAKTKYKIANDTKISISIVISTFPALILGYLFNDVLENYFRNILWGIIFLLSGSVLMIFAEHYYSNKKSKSIKVTNITYKKALIIGFYQCLALFSGFSRSGSTISGGMLLGLSRESAARYSFLMSLPVILSAGLYKLITADISEFINLATLYGFIFSFISGILAINILLKFLKSNNLYVFIFYRIILAIIIYGYVIL